MYDGAFRSFLHTDDGATDDRKQHEEEELAINKGFGLDNVHGGVEKRAGVEGRGAVKDGKGKDKLSWGELVGGEKVVLKRCLCAWCQLHVVRLSVRCEVWVRCGACVPQT